MFANHCKAVARLEVKHFDKDNQRLCTLLHVNIANYVHSYRDIYETNNNGQAALKDLVD